VSGITICADANCPYKPECGQQPADWVTWPACNKESAYRGESQDLEEEQSAYRKAVIIAATLSIAVGNSEGEAGSDQHECCNPE
jgi:hypothetical protein